MSGDDVVATVIADLVAGAAALALYGTDHPLCERSVDRLARHLDDALAEEPQLDLLLVGQELFVRERPVSRSTRQAGALVRRMHRRGVDSIAFSAGVDAGELRTFLADLAAPADQPPASLPHVRSGVVQLGEGDGDGAAEFPAERLPRLRDRISLLGDVHAAVSAGQPLRTNDLQEIAGSVLSALDRRPDPVAHLADWQGEERWPAVHGHNVAVLAAGLARIAGLGRGIATELALAGLVHDLGKLFLPPDLLEREAELAGDELEIVLDHPRIALELLLPVPALPPVVLTAAFEHRLNFNGTGYPRLPRPRRPHPASRLISVVDAFDILLTLRGSHGTSTSESTGAWLEAHAGTVLDPDWVRAFLEVLAASPAMRRRSRPGAQGVG